MWSKKPTPVSICAWPDAVEIQFELDLGFGRLALDAGGAGHGRVELVVVNATSLATAQ